jgi:hypothetical protein
VVRRGRMGVPVGEERENFRGRGAKREVVPVPVLRGEGALVEAWEVLRVLDGIIPVRTMFSGLEDLADQVEILELLVSWSGGGVLWSCSCCGGSRRLFIFLQRDWSHRLGFRD